MADAPYIGEAAALATALFWTVSSAAFAVATKRIGSIAVNIIRLVMAFAYLALVNGITRGWWLPLDAPPRTWILLSLSGFVGFTLGDLFLFEAFSQIGARVSMLVMASAPIMTGLIGWAFLGERPSALAGFGILLTAAGIGMVVLKPGRGRLTLAHPGRGLLLAFLGALGQAGGLVLSKAGMHLPDGGEYPAFASSQLRSIAGIAGFALIYSVAGLWPKVGAGLRDRKALGFSALGALAGPFIGVTLSLVAVAKASSAGIASSLMSVSPVIMLPVAVLFLGERLRWPDVLGALTTVAGVAFTFF